MLAAIEQAIAEAPGARALDAISATVWRAAGDGVLADDDAHALLERIAERRTAGAATKAEAEAAPRRTIFPTRRAQRPRDPAEAVARRRRVAGCGALPPHVLERFTPSAQATLAVVVQEVREHGDCRLCYDAIAARAGCSRSSVRNAIRRAQALGFVTVEHRPVKGAKNLTNIVRVADAAWRLWIQNGTRRAKAQGDRGQRLHPHGYENKKKGLPAGATETPKPDFRRSRRRRR